MRDIPGLDERLSLLTGTARDEGTGQIGKRASVAFWFAVIAIAALGVWLHRAALRVPLVADDLVQRAMLDGEFPSSRSPFDLYNFADGSAADHQRLVDAGALPWWAAPNLRGAFFRPVASATIAIDHALFGNGSVGPHVQSLLWYIAAIGALAALARSLFGARVGAIAALLFAVDESLVGSISWAANRNALISVAFAVIAIRSYVRAQEGSNRRRDRIIAFAGFVLSIGAGEIGACMLAYVVGYELFASRGRVVDRVRASWPWILPLAALTVAYRWAHRGAAGSDVYVDPTGQPIAYLKLLPARGLALFADLLFARPFFTTFPTPGLLVRLALEFAVAVALTVMVCRRLSPDARRHCRWLAFGSATAMLPTFGSIVTERLTLPAEPGVAVLVALIISAGVDSLRLWFSGRTGRFEFGSFVRFGAAVLVLVLHVGIATTRTLAASRAWRDYHSAIERSVAASMPPADQLRDATVVILSADEPTTPMIPYIWHLHGAPLPRELRVLAFTTSPLIVRRTSQTALDVHTVEDVWMQNPGERLSRPRALRLRAGERISLRGMVVTILEVGPNGPRVVRFDFDRSLDDPHMMFFLVTWFGLLRVPPPAIGGVGFVPSAALPLFVPVRQ